VKSIINIKNIIQVIIALSIINIVYNYQTGIDINPYKSIKSIKHSLFVEKDTGDRMSISQSGVPQLLGKNEEKSLKLKEPEKMVAMRIVEHYEEMFDYLDYDPVDDFLSAEELSQAFKEFGWPKSIPEMVDDVEYSQTVIQQYDKSGKNTINFVEFCKFMEDMWTFADILNQQKCQNGLNKAQNVFSYLFKWLDRDQDLFITPEDMIYGISRIMVRDVDMKEIQKTFAKYDPTKTGKINFDYFMLAITNGYLDNTFKDALNTENFMP
jgi:Ca2+-binding EF-hand superfamily protein